MLSARGAQALLFFYLVEQAAEHESRQAGRPGNLGDGEVEAPAEHQPPQPRGERNAVDGVVKPARARRGGGWGVGGW